MAGSLRRFGIVLAVVCFGVVCCASQILAAPIISRQPESQTVYKNQNAYFIVELEDMDGASFVWQYNDGNSGWVNSPLPSARTSILEVPGTLERNGLWYRCRVTQSGTVTSNVVILTVIDDQDSAVIVSAINYQSEISIGVIVFIGFLSGAFLIYVFFSKFRGG